MIRKIENNILRVENIYKKVDSINIILLPKDFKINNKEMHTKDDIKKYRDLIFLKLNCIDNKVEIDQKLSNNIELLKF